jgi:HSP20 family protein
MDGFFGDLSPMQGGIVNQNFKVDVRESETQFCVEADLPGVKKEEIQVDIDDGHLTISVTREEHTEEEKGSFVHRERRSGTMQRMLFLESAASSGTTARFVDGALDSADA